MIRPLLLFLALVFVFSGCALNSRDRHFLQNRGIPEPLYAKMTHHEPLTLDEIIELSQKGVPGPFIVHYLRPTYFVYNLSSGDVTRLRQSGVEDGLIRYLAATPSMFSPSHVPVEYEPLSTVGGDHYDYWRY